MRKQNLLCAVSYLALFCFLVVSRARVHFCCARLIVWLALFATWRWFFAPPALLRSRCSVDNAHVVSFTVCRLQWRTQKIFMGGFGSGSYGDHLHLVCAVCDVTI